LLNFIDRSALVPEDEAAKAGILPDQVKVNKKYGGGFPANVEGLHHLHCLVFITLNYLAKNLAKFISESSSAIFALQLRLLQERRQRRFQEQRRSAQIPHQYAILFPYSSLLFFFNVLFS
jgi:hypothetical protein